MSTTNYSGETIDRIKKLERIRSLGVNPFANRFDLSHQISQITTKYPSNIDEENGNMSPLRSVEEVIATPTSDIRLAGRIMLHRSFGKICFATISDGTGRIQVLFSRDNCSINVDGKSITELTSDTETISAYKFAEKLIDLGDFIGVQGELFYTHKGELTLFVSEYTFLTKAIRPLPEKFHGVTDDEERFRKRYLDMALSEDLRAMFYRKAKFWEVTRNFLKNRGFLEVETPTIEHTTGGAEARPFATHHNDYDVDVYMRICIGELWQKRLMAGGFPKTFEIGRAYRNEGSSPEHLQEFTNMEFYWAFASYEDGMKMVQDMYQQIALQTYGRTTFSAKGHYFDLAGEWPKMDYLEAVESKTGINILTASDEDMRNKLRELGVQYEGDNRERLTDTLWKYVRKQITGPAFLINHPEIISPLAKRSIENPGRVERFQPIIAGSEVGNGFSELNDPIDQRDRFEAQHELLKKGDEEAMMPEWDFVEMLEHGMPPTCGFGFGERFFAFLEDKPLRECQYFPFMRPIHIEERAEK
ncbi:lysine--tRNA ligase [Candidatus Gracilibacteria bacterium]|nr:lysine--tRNA ligase [Candidatus Gracilibacteria bacterium]